MLARKVQVQITVFVLIALVGISFTGAKYAGLDRLVGSSGYEVTMRMPEAGGIFDNAEVTYRGVPVGRVGTLRLTGNGVEVPLNIESSDQKIPKNVQAAVADRSAVGEQYVDLRPTTDKGPYLDDGSVIPASATSRPPPVEDLTKNLDAFAKSVPQDALRTVTHELGTAFRDNGGNLQTILDTSREFTAEADKHLPQTQQLLADSKQVLRTQNEQGSSVRSFSKDLRALSGQLQRSDPDLRGVIDRAPRAAQQVGAAVRENQQIGPLLANLTSTSELLATKEDNLEQTMTLYPAVIAASRTVAPGDGRAHFGLVLNEFDPPPCTAGYEKTDRRPGNDLTPTPVNTEAHCAEPPGSPTNVRGAQNAPR